MSKDQIIYKVNFARDFALTLGDYFLTRNFLTRIFLTQNFRFLTRIFVNTNFSGNSYFVEICCVTKIVLNTVLNKSYINPTCLRCPKGNCRGLVKNNESYPKRESFQNIFTNNTKNRRHGESSKQLKNRPRINFFVNFFFILTRRPCNTQIITKMIST